MPLVNLTTNLKSLRYGKDVPGGGSSRQPYVTRSIPKDMDDIGRTGGPDFLLRGGTLLPRRIGNDVSRLTKMFFDFRSPAGPLFIAKQNVLSLINVNSEAGFAKPAKLIMNQGVYTPLEAIIQAGTNAIGMHVPKQGYNPFDNLNPDGPKNFGFTSNRNLPLAFPTYLRTINKDRLDGPDGKGFGKLKNLADKKIFSLNAPNKQNVLSYLGGPGSTLGVGKTRIPITSRTTFKPDDIGFYSSGISTSIGKSALSYNELFNVSSDPLNAQSADINARLTNKLGTGQFGYSNPIPLTPGQSTPRIPDSQGGTYLTNPNFQETLGVSQTRPATLSFDPFKKFESRVNLGHPGKRGNLSSYTIGKRVINSDISGSISGNSSYLSAVDTVNAFPLYRSDSVTSDNNKNDFVKFRIGVIDNNNPQQKTYIHFRAIIDALSDNYTSDWEGQKFMGRSEEFYKYSGFGRTVSLDWTVAAQSKQELIPMYQKLNYLASVSAGDYSDVGYMRGNLITLSVGGWFQEQVGFMSGLTLNVPQDSPWEIGITDALNKTSIGEGNSTREINSDPSVQEMPMIVNVTGFQFTPIHDFVPRVQRNTFNGGKVDGGGNFISNYGNERYINLKGGLGSNYDGGPGNEGISNGSLNYMPKKPAFKFGSNPFGPINLDT